VHRLQDTRRDPRETTRLTAAPPATRGRFAPSPSGPLHFGSLLTAVGSYAEVRAHGGAWLLRIEDLDAARVVPGAADAIQHTLDAYGLHWDETVWYQSQRQSVYKDVLAMLRARRLSYGCACSRQDIAAVARIGAEGPIYPGTCRHGLTPGKRARSERLLTPDEDIVFVDDIQGAQRQNLAREVGDFVIRRADGVIAYQLAVVVDDAAQGIDRIVRGADLLLSTPRQLYLQRLLALPTPRYAHLPLVVDEQRRKLSKSQADTPISARDPLPGLRRVWQLLGQTPFVATSVAEFWAQAIPLWSLAAVPRVATMGLHEARAEAPRQVN